MNRIRSQTRVLCCFLAMALLTASSVFSQGPGASPELQQKLAALKQSVTLNQQALRRYTWTETQETVLKGETKSSKLFQCEYGPDGKVQKTALSSSPAPQQQRGLKGRIIEKKKGEMQDYMERVALLIQSYVPPASSSMQDSFQAGKSAIQPSANGIVMIAFRDYAKPGDGVTLAFDTVTKKVRSYNVSTYLDSPDDVVTLKVVFDSLPDGTNYSAQTVLDATAKQVQIRTTSSGYTKL